MTYDPLYQSPYRYADPRPFGSAPTLCRLAGIFNLIVAGVDLLYMLMLTTFGILILTGVIPPDTFEDGGPGTGPPIGLLVGFSFGFAGVALCAGLLKIVGALKLLRRRPGAFGWGLAAGIIGCVQFWCGYGCVLPMAAGIFTIVVVSLENVRNYLRNLDTPA